MWYKANQKGYRCGGNLRHGERFCLNKLHLKSSDLEQIDECKQHQIQEKLSIVEKKSSDLEKIKRGYVNLYIRR